MNGSAHDIGAKRGEESVDFKKYAEEHLKTEIIQQAWKNSARALLTTVKLLF